MTGAAVPPMLHANCWAAIRAMSRQMDTPHMTVRREVRDYPARMLGPSGAASSSNRWIRTRDTPPRPSSTSANLQGGVGGGRGETHCGTAQGKTRQGVISSNPGLREMDERYVSDGPSEEQDQPGN